MKITITFFTVGMFFFVGTTAAPNPNPGIPPATSNKQLLGLGVPEEVVIKWGPTLRTLSELYREEGPSSPRVHRQLVKLVVHFLADRGYIGIGYPTGVPFPCDDFQHLRYLNYVFITDFKRVYNVVPYDESYDDFLVTGEEADAMLRELVVIAAEGIITLVTSKTHASPQQTTALLNIVQDPAFFGF